MIASTGVRTLSTGWTDWHLLFARQPEPDLEFSEEDLDEAVPPPAPPMKAPKRSGKGPLYWILLLMVLGGLGYVAWDPDGAMRFIEPYLDGGKETAPPVPRNNPGRAQTPTSIPPELADKGSASIPESTSRSSEPPTSGMKSAPAFANVAVPQFSEGQRVTVIPDPARPTSPVFLFIDPAGTQGGTTVPVGAALTVLDGDYQRTGWVYTVQTEDGRKGWIPERSLKHSR